MPWASQVKLLMVGLAVSGAACATIFTPRPDPTRFFILSASGARAGTPQAGPDSDRSGRVIGLGPIAFPEYLARPEIAIRSADNRIEISPNGRWAEPLDVTFKRVLAQDLANALGGAQVITFPWFGSPAKFSYRVEIQIDRFDADANNTAHLVASWNLSQDAGGAVVYASAADLTVPAAPAHLPGAAARTGADDGVMAAALSEAADRLAREIADAILRLPAQSELVGKTGPD